MIRLTHIDSRGWYIDDQSAAYDGRRRGEEINRLAAYEDTGLEPKDIKEVFSEEEVFKFAGQNIGIAPARLRELARAEQDGRLVVLPEVPEETRKQFADSLHDVFTEWANYDPSVGLFGMSKEETALANAIMTVLNHV